MPQHLRLARPEHSLLARRLVRGLRQRLVNRPDLHVSLVSFFHSCCCPQLVIRQTYQRPRPVLVGWPITEFYLPLSASMPFIRKCRLWIIDWVAYSAAYL